MSNYPPCLNPNCKSYGKPHPNCRCYSHMAKGGDPVFCAQTRMHDQGCEYYAEGGMTGSPDFVPDDKFIADDSPATEESSDFIPDDKFVADKVHDGETPDFVPEDEFVPDEEKYSTPGQQLATAAEGAAQGFAGPLATAAELGLSKLGIPGMSGADIAGRQEANPWTHGLSETAGLGLSLYTGVGEAALLAKAGGAASKAAKLSKAGSAVLSGAISNGLIQGGDEVSKLLLGQGDPNDATGAAIVHMGAASLFGAALGGFGAKVSEVGLDKIKTEVEDKIGRRAYSFLMGLGEMAETSGDDAPSIGKDFATKYPDMDAKAYRAGQKIYEQMIRKVNLATGVGAWEGYKEEGIPGLLKGAIKGYIVGKGVNIASEKILAPVVLKMLSSGDTSGFFEAMNHAENIAKGSQAIDKGVESLFNMSKIGAQQGLNSYINDEDKKQRKKLDDAIGEGGADADIQNHIYSQQQTQPAEGYAQGGQVESVMPDDRAHGVETHYPEHSMMIAAAKGRVSQYLRGMKPQDSGGRFFDEKMEDKQKQRSYDRALDIANKPLKIMDEIRKGTIQPEHLQHLSAMYPEVSDLLQKRLTQRLVKAKLDGEKPPYKIRQAMSLFMGTALSSELLPQNIMAAQQVFQAAPQAQQTGQPVTKNKRNTSTLTKSDQAYLTRDQALSKRGSKV